MSAYALAHAAELALVRATLYGLLSAGFYAPSKMLLERIRPATWQKSLHKVLCAWPSGRDIARSCAFLQESAEALLRKAGSLGADELNREYTKLFLVPGPAQLHPYESMYTLNSAGLMARTADDVLKRYHEDGLTVSGTARELPDHFALECEYMAHLSQRQLSAIAADRSDAAGALSQRSGDFLRQHLGAWGIEFAQDVRSLAATDFYMGLGRLAERFVGWDASQTCL
jgi:TorA maturation chaperone TorD